MNIIRFPNSVAISNLYNGIPRPCVRVCGINYSMVLFCGNNERYNFVVVSSPS